MVVIRSLEAKATHLAETKKGPRLENSRAENVMEIAEKPTAVAVGGVAACRYGRRNRFILVRSASTSGASSGCRISAASVMRAKSEGNWP